MVGTCFEVWPKALEFRLEYYLSGVSALVSW
jgi:hypothetical protein